MLNLDLARTSKPRQVASKTPEATSSFTPQLDFWKTHPPSWALAWRSTPRAFIGPGEPLPPMAVVYPATLGVVSPRPAVYCNTQQAV